MDDAERQRTCNVLVVGGARGIGRAFVDELLRRPDCGVVFATSRSVAPGAPATADSNPVPVPMDVECEESVRRAAAVVSDRVDAIHLLVYCAGLLHDGEALQPEKRLEAIRPEALQRSFAVHAIGALLVAKHFLSCIPRRRRSVLAFLSARVGSIGDNRLGGWYAYRASKAALNQAVRTLSVELGRRAPGAICVALHPGTVDTGLSRPFQASVPDEQLFAPPLAARQLLGVIDGLGPEDTGSFRAWDGQEIPW